MPPLLLFFAPSGVSALLPSHILPGKRPALPLQDTSEGQGAAVWGGDQRHPLQTPPAREGASAKASHQVEISQLQRDECPRGCSPAWTSGCAHTHTPEPLDRVIGVHPVLLHFIRWTLALSTSSWSGTPLCLSCEQAGQEGAEGGVGGRAVPLQAETSMEPTFLNF